LLKHGAFRAAMVMAWNLAYSHLCDFVLKIDDFADELKESEVIAICASARIITGDMQNVLNVGLRRRNTAAHPSRSHITQLQAEAHIEDLVQNFVLKII
jgi:hypothetical protein